MTPEEIEDIKKMWEHAETIYVSKEAYDELVRCINEPPDPEAVAKLKKLLERKAPWDDSPPIKKNLFTHLFDVIKLNVQQFSLKNTMIARKFLTFCSRPFIHKDRSNQHE